MKTLLKFDSNQEHQLAAVAAVVDLFANSHDKNSDFDPKYDFELISDGNQGVRENGIRLNSTTLLKNLQTIQARNSLQVSQSIISRNFSVEMETGTGKTYVYLRTIFELHQKYKLNKFVIVVPSVAVREGVIASIRTLKDHFATLFEGLQAEVNVYNSKRPSALRSFGQSSNLQILIMNIQAFEKMDNIINQTRDQFQGHKPIDFINQTNPVLVLDEPQNISTDARDKALSSLNPLITLRYSATHRNPHNLVYRLDPVQAYQLGLVKQIEVLSVTDDMGGNAPFIRVESIKAEAGRPQAILTVEKGAKGGLKDARIKVRSGQALDERTNRPLYSGWQISNLSIPDMAVEFTNGTCLKVGEEVGRDRDAVLRQQIHETIRVHLDRELSFYDRFKDQDRVKVLSLFFVDRVANYAPSDGKIRAWFIESYESLKEELKYRKLNLPDSQKAHGGYFATDSKNKIKDLAEGSNSSEARTAVDLILRDKESLLNPDTPLRFIFTHSALREGWDNPNVFQVCVLREVGSQIDRRQQVGRGLRLPVQASGQRLRNTEVNRVTVIASESFEDFAAALQTEISEDFGVNFKSQLVKHGSRKKVVSKLPVEDIPFFSELWKRINKSTMYSVSYDSNDLILKTVNRLKEKSWHGNSARTHITLSSINMEYDDRSVATLSASVEKEKFESRTVSFSVPDLVGIIIETTGVTRRSAVAILQASDLLMHLDKNPQAVIAVVCAAIKESQIEMLGAGISYKATGRETYDISNFTTHEMEVTLDNLMSVSKSVAPYIEVQSEIERSFARDLENREDVRLYLKLPRWFQVSTPVGAYIPDWAIVVRSPDGTDQLYLIAETKSSTSESERRVLENFKVRCGRAHFKAINADYREVITAADI